MRLLVKLIFAIMMSVFVDSNTTYILSYQQMLQYYNHTFGTQVECMHFCSADNQCTGFSFELGKTDCYLSGNGKPQKDITIQGMPFYEKFDLSTKPTTETMTTDAKTTLNSQTTTVENHSTTILQTPKVTTKKHTTTKSVPKDPVFNFPPCTGANRSVLISDKPIWLHQVIFYECYECRTHAMYYINEDFDQFLYTDSGYFVMVNHKGNACDLLVECLHEYNKLGSNKAFSQFTLNGISMDGIKYVLRITWNGSKWTTANDDKKKYTASTIPDFVDTIKCM